MFFTQSSATEPGSQPVSQALDRGEVGESLQGDRFYLRKYQAISATMSSSRDRTSTVGRMWWLGTERLLRKKERQSRSSGSTVNKEAGREAKADNICAYIRVCKCLAEFMCLSHVYIA